MGRAVRVHQAVHAEVSVVGKIVEIAAVAIHIPVIRRAAHVDGVITPLPHKAAHKAVVPQDLLHVVLNIPGAVAHGVDELALHKGLGVGGVRKVGVDPFRGGVHPAEHIQHIGAGLHGPGGMDRAFVMHKAAGIIGLDPAAGFLQVGAVAGFIAQRPHHHAGVVLIPDHAALCPVQNSFFIRGFHRQLGEGVFKLLPLVGIRGLAAMAFHIRLGNDIEAVFAAKL